MPQLPRTKHRTADRQAELVQAALQLAAQHSPAEVTTAALAQAIGITQGGVFKHFTEFLTTCMRGISLMVAFLYIML